MSGLDYASVSEKDWQKQVLELLGYHGWRAAHFGTARAFSGSFATVGLADSAGFPDLLCVHPKAGDLMAVELKSEKGVLSPTQAQWLAWLENAGVETHVYRPRQVDEVIERISAPVRRLRRSTT